MYKDVIKIEMIRRNFLKIAGSVAALGVIPESIQKALAIPAHQRTGTLQDVEHIVILMQENRSFDHYFCTFNGVRGFGDPWKHVTDNRLSH
ncbi:conserved hypothetical protein [Enterobacterales bacterium 8AC]|nr:conserved hypothetical protein [Enterobacterales bacterium 8AC]